jgi:hypothetical protein
MSEITNHYIIGHLDWNSRARFVAGLIVAGVLFGSLGLLTLRPWDPFGAISLQLVQGPFGLLLRTAGLLLAVGVFAAILMDARLPLFGTFAACIGMAIPILKTAGMDYVMVRQQTTKAMEHPQDFWGFLILEALSWTVVLIALLAGTLITEQWLKRNDSPLIEAARGEPKKSETTVNVWLRGLGGTAITVVLGLFLIALFAASMKKGQIVFACAAGFFLAGLTAEQIAENNHPIWQVAAVPVVAVIAYVYTWFHPDRPPGLEAILNIAPNNLARVLPVEYLFIGTIGAIFGNWTSHRVRYSKEHD